METEMRELSKIVAALKDNPIYALSLGSRELFHSNFLGWMFEKYPTMIGVVYGGAVTGDVTVRREWHNLDLVITFDAVDERHAIVIEIKVKDVPRQEQLNSYDETVKRILPGFTAHKILLSLVEPPWSVNDDKEWKRLSLAELGLKIQTKIVDADLTSDHAAIIRLYAQLCIDLGALMVKVTAADMSNRDYFFVKKDRIKENKVVDAALTDAGFAATVNKQRSSSLEQAIASALKAASGEFFPFKPEPNSGLANTQPHTGASIVLKLPGDFELDIGVHIQNRQYRRVLSFNRFAVPRNAIEGGEKDIKAFIDATDQWNWMFGESHQGGWFEHPQDGFFKGSERVPTAHLANNLICRYAPIHMYQYTTIGPDSGVPVGELVWAVIADLKYAAQLLSCKEYVARFEHWPQGSRIGG